MKKLLLTLLVAVMGITAWAGDWTRCTSVSDLTSGGTFIIGYEPTAHSGIIIPMKNVGGTATISTAGYMAADASGIDMSTVTATEDYEFSIVASKTVDGAICIKAGDNYIGNTNTRNNCKLFAAESETTSFGVTVGDNDVFSLMIEANTANATNYTHLQYNSNSGSERFAVYANTQKNLVFYKKAVDATAVKVVNFSNLGYESWGKNAGFSGSTWPNLEQTVDGVKFNYDRNSSSTYANTSAIRFYKSNDLKFTAPDGYAITDITWTGSAFKADVTTDVQTCASTTSALSWSGLAKSVTFTRPSNADGYITLSAVSVTINKIFESTLSEGYTSICFNYNAEIVDDNTAAYAVSAINGNSLVLTAVDVMKANKGYIVFSNSAENTDIVATTKVADDVVNLLSGVAARTAVAELGIQGTEGFAYPWILNKSHVFVQYTGEFIPANKAYLDGKVLQDAGLSMSASLRLDFEGMEDGYQTAISLTPSLSEGEGACYDLFGRKSNGKGLMIQNGKVILVK